MAEVCFLVASHILVLYLGAIVGVVCTDKEWRSMTPFEFKRTIATLKKKEKQRRG